MKQIRNMSIVFALFLLTGQSAALASTIPPDYTIRTGSGNEIVWEWEVNGESVSKLDTLRPGQIWTDKSVYYPGDSMEVEPGVFEFVYEGTATIRIYIWARQFEKPSGELILLGTDKTISLTSAIGDFELAEAIYPPGVTFTHNPGAGTLNFVIPEALITDPDEPLIIQYNLYLEDRPAWLTNFWYSTLDSFIEVAFEPHSENLYYWTTEEVTYNAFDAPKMSWNAGNGLSSGAIIDRELDITISFGSNSSPANQTAASVPWENVNYRNRYWAQNAQVTIGGVSTSYWWHLEWQKGGPYIFTVHGLITQEIDGILVPLDVVYEISLGGPGGSASVPGSRTITGDVSFRRTFAEGNPVSLFEWNEDGHLVYRTPIIAQIMLIDEYAEHAFSVGTLTLEKLFPPDGEAWHHLDWGVDDETLFTARLRTGDGHYVVFAEDNLIPNLFTFDGFVDSAERATILRFSVNIPAVLVGLPRYMTADDFDAGIAISYAAYEFFEGFFRQEELYLAYALIRVAHSLDGGPFSLHPAWFEVIADGQRTVTMRNHFSHGIGFLEIFKLLDGFPADWDVQDDTVFYVRIWDMYAQNYLLFDYGRVFAPDSPFYGTIWCIGNHVVGFTEPDPVGRQMDVRMELPISRNKPIRLSNVWTWGCYQIVEVRRAGTGLPEETTSPHLDPEWVAFWNSYNNRIPFYDRTPAQEAVWEANRVQLQHRIDHEWEEIRIIESDAQWHAASIYDWYWGVTYSDNNSHICPNPECGNFGQSIDHETCLEDCPDNQLRFNETIRIFASNRFKFKCGMLELSKDLCENAADWGIADHTIFHARVRSDDGRYLVFVPDSFEGRAAWRVVGFVEIDDTTGTYGAYRVLCPVGSTAIPASGRTEIPFHVNDPALLIEVPSHPFGEDIRYTLVEFFSAGLPHVPGMPLAAGAPPAGFADREYVITDQNDLALPNGFTVPHQQSRYVTIRNIFRPAVRDLLPVVFELNGGNVGGSTADIVYRRTYLSAVGVPPAPVYAGHIFLGWRLDGTGALLSAAQVSILTVTEPLTFVAQWRSSTEPKYPQDFEHQAYIIGFDDGLVHPRAATTRAEAATIFFRLITDVQREHYWMQTNPFPDVILENWFNNAVSTMTNAGIFLGTPDGSFQPNRPVTRAELAAAIVRFMDEMPDSGTAGFNDITGHWAEDYINAAALRGWVRGDTGFGGRFRPDDPITRAETAAMINRIFDRLPEYPGDLLPGMVTWSDNMNQSAWYYLYIQEATNSHTYARKADGIHESWKQLIEPRPWALLERPNSRPQDMFAV